MTGWSEADRLYSADGQPIGWSRDGAVYASDGAHVGWLERGQFRDAAGCVVAWTTGAVGSPAKPKVQDPVRSPVTGPIPRKPSFSRRMSRVPFVPLWSEREWDTYLRQEAEAGASPSRTLGL